MKIRHLIIVLTIILCLTSCGGETPPPAQTASPASSASAPQASINRDGIIEQYTINLSDTRYGRTLGSFGNDNAADLLIEELSKLGIEPFSDDGYAIPFDADYTDYDSGNIVMKAVLRDDTEREFVFGLDFFISLGYSDFEFTFENTDRGFAFVDRGKRPPSGSNVVLLTETKEFTQSYADGGSGRITVQLTPDAYKSLSGFKQLDLTYKLIRESVTASNIAGIIRGGGNSCVYLSAYYDAAAGGGGLSFPGASSAAGAAALLYAAQKLKSISDNSRFGFDIVIVFLNAEYGYGLGSAYFTKSLPEYDYAWNLHLASLGTGTSFSFDSTLYPAFISDLTEALNLNNLRAGNQTAPNGSHTRFMSRGIPFPATAAISQNFPPIPPKALTFLQSMTLPRQSYQWFPNMAELITP